MLLSSLVIGLFLLVHEMGNAGERTVARRTEARVFESGPDPRKPMLESRVSELESRIRVLESDLARLRSNNRIQTYCTGLRNLLSCAVKRRPMPGLAGQLQRRTVRKARR